MAFVAQKKALRGVHHHQRGAFFVVGRLRDGEVWVLQNGWLRSMTFRKSPADEGMNSGFLQILKGPSASSA